MGDLSPFDVVDCNDADATAWRGGEAFEVPEMADWCVAVVPVDGSAATAAGCAGVGDGTGDAGEEVVGSAE